MQPLPETIEYSRVLAAIAKWARQEPDRLAIISGNQTISYGAFWREIHAFANQLCLENIRCAGLLADNSLPWCLADLAAVLADIPLVPLPPFFTAEQREHALQSAGADRLITYQEGAWQFLPLTNPAVTLPHGTTKITYTSGTTGAPKGVCLSQNGMETVAESLLQILGTNATQRHLALLPLSVLLENVAGFYTTMLAGGCYITPSLLALRFNGMQPDGARILRHLQEANITSVILVPEYAIAIINALRQAPVSLPDLRFMAVGGAHVPESLLEEAQALGLPIYQGYGLSEAASVVAVNTPKHHKAGSVGKLLPHIASHIAKDGELILKNPAFLGYIGETPHQEFYATGDIVYQDAEGFLFIHGRKRHIIITQNARNISPEWPESLLNTQPEIAHALVAGEAKSHLVALITPAHEGADIDHAICKANAQLPEYAHIKNWTIVPTFTTENHLRTTSGKVIRNAALRQYQSLIDSLYHKEKQMDFFTRLQNETWQERQALYDVPLLQDAVTGGLSKEAYLAFLEQAYHHVKHTVPLMMRAGSRLPVEKEWLREALVEYIKEETGHQEWILNDIRFTGGDDEAVRHGAPNAATELMVAYAYDSVMRNNPVSFFGMVFVLEGTSTALATQAAESISESLNLPKKCFSYLTSHGALDISHMEFFKKLMNKIDDAKDQEAIIHMARRMFVLYANMFRSLPHQSEARHAA